MKKISVLFLCVILSLSSIFTLSACKDDENDNEKDSMVNNENESYNNNDDHSSDNSTNNNTSDDTQKDEVNNNNEQIGSEGLEYTLSSDGTYYILSRIGACSDEHIVIPSTYQNLPVKIIDEDAFYESHIKSVVIPESIVVIKKYAFYNCSMLEKIYFNATCMNDLSENTYIFLSDVPIEVIIGKNVTKIPSYLFNFKPYSITGELNIKSIEFEDESSCQIIGNYAFANAIISKITLPDSVTHIGCGAFRSCSLLEEIKMPENLQTIDNEAFYECRRLKEVIFPDTLSSIGKNAFYHCRSFTTITIPKSVTEIGINAFENCSKLVEIENLSELPISLGNTNNGKITSNALNVYTDKDGSKKTFETSDGFIFYEDGDICYLLGYKGDSKFVKLPENCHGKNYEIYIEAFIHSDMNTIFIPSSVTAIKTRAFILCNHFVNIVIEDCTIKVNGGSELPSGSNVNVYFLGTESEWSNNSFLKNRFNYSKKYYYSESEPTTDGNFWHYDENGEIAFW